MINQRMQARSRRLAERVVAPLARTGIDPNVLTITGLVLSFPTAVIIALGWQVAGGVMLLFSAGFDMFDGAVARVSNRRSDFGAFLDSTMDRWGEGVIFTGLTWYFVDVGARAETVLALLTLIGSMLISYTRARAEGLGVECKVGFFQRPERLIVLGIALLTPFGVLSGAMWFLAIATQLTAAQRVLHVHSQIERAKKLKANEGDGDTA